MGSIVQRNGQIPEMGNIIGEEFCNKRQITVSVAGLTKIKNYATNLPKTTKTKLTGVGKIEHLVLPRRRGSLNPKNARSRGSGGIQLLGT